MQLAWNVLFRQQGGLDRMIVMVGIAEQCEIVRV